MCNKNILTIIGQMCVKCNSQHRLVYHYSSTFFFTEWVGNVSYVSINEQLWCRVSALQGENFKRRFPISKVSAGNITLCRRHSVACELRVERTWCTRKYSGRRITPARRWWVHGLLCWIDSDDNKQRTGSERGGKLPWLYFQAVLRPSSWCLRKAT
jgi:hypothetical protein